MSTSQTLRRGLAALEHIALAERAPTIDDIADDLGVHRSNAYRIVRTLEEHGFVRRNAAGACVPTLRLAALGRFAQPSLQSAAVPALAALANELETTCFLVMADGNEALTLESLEPTTTRFHLAYRPGIRHPLDRGAPGLAILAGRAPRADEPDGVAEARRRGWAFTTGEVIAGLAAVAVPLPGIDASIATVFLADADADLAHIANRLAATAADIARNRPEASASAS